MSEPNVNSGAESLKIGRPGLSMATHYMLLAGLLTIMAFVAIGDHHVRLSRSDNGGVIPIAECMLNPDRFAGDQLSTYAPMHARASILYWLPAVLYRDAGIPLEAMEFLFRYLQIVLLGISTFYYSQQVMRKPGIGWLSVAFVYLAGPHAWGLSNYGGDVFGHAYHSYNMPWVCLAASAMAIQGRTVATGLFLLWGALMHAGAALVLTTMIGAFWFYSFVVARSEHDLRGIVGKLLIFGAVTAVALIPYWYYRLPLDQRITAPEYFGTIHVHTHLFPWNNFKAFYGSLTSIIGFGILTVLAMRSKIPVQPSFVRFWVTICCSGAALGALQPLGAWFGIIELLQLAPLRMMYVPALLAVPVVICYLLEKASHEYFWVRWSAYATLFVSAWYGRCFFWGPLLVFGLIDAAESKATMSFQERERKKASSWIRASLAAFTVWVVTIPLVRIGRRVIGRIGNEALALAVWPAIHYVPMMILVIAAGAISLLLGPAVERLQRLLSLNRYGDLDRSQRALFVCLVILLSWFMVECWQRGGVSRQPGEVAYYDAQVWARNNTREDDLFMVPGSWTSVARRPVFQPSLMQMYIYSGDRRAKKHDDEVLEFLGLADYFPREAGKPICVWCPDRGRAFFARQGQVLANLDQDTMLRMAKKFGFNYVVRSADGPLQLPVAYRNDYFIIYRMP